MRTARLTCVVGLLLLVPSALFAQASITGVVKDTSGAVLPGVSVEASSPALIEKVRLAVSDAAGRYRIIDLRSGTYAVTFSLTGFSSIRREGIELPGTFTATVDAELTVGNLAETITVSGELPVVDVQSVRRQTVINSEVISSIPAARSYNALMSLMPNTALQSGAASDVQATSGTVVFGGIGGRANEGRLTVDGLNVGAVTNGAGVSSYRADVGSAQEVTMTTSGGMGEAEVGGPSLNIVPREGGNSVKGLFFASGVTPGMIGDNYTDDLLARGLTSSGKITRIWDFNFGAGGPVVKDRVWFFGQAREEGSYRKVAGMFANANAGDPTRWTYVADTSRPAATVASSRNFALRLTAQASTRHKFSGFWDEQLPCEGAAAPNAPETVKACRHSNANEAIGGAHGSLAPATSATVSPEAGSYRDYGQRVQQFKWTAPVTNRLLLEASAGSYTTRWGGNPMPGGSTLDLIRVVEQCAAGCAANGNIPGLTYRSGNWQSSWQGNYTWRTSASYVAGAQSMKVGYQGSFLVDNRKSFTNSENLQYRFNNGIPDQFTTTINAIPTTNRTRSDAFYGQDQITFGRVTLQGAIRYDHVWSYYPEQQVGPVRFFPTPRNYPRTTGIEGYHDVTPRGGLAMDVFGTGRTSLKVNVGKYLEAAQAFGIYTAINPVNRLSTTATRTWTDGDRDFVVDCDLANAAVQDRRASGGDFCGARNANFGLDVFDATYDPMVLGGWGVRPGDWQVGAAIQQELFPRVSAEFGYQRRWLGGFTATDNRARTAADHTSFTISAPVDARLPGGGGYALAPMVNANPDVATLVDNYITWSTNYGDQTQATHSFNLNLTARPRSGLMLQGGFNTARTISDSCEIQAALPETAPTNPWCHQSSGWGTRMTALGVYTIPKIDVLVSGTMRSEQGAALSANWAVPNSVIQPSLGRPLSANAATVTVNLVEPGTLYGDRVNEVDVRIAKILKFGRTRTNVGFDLYNLINAAPVLTYTQTYSPTTTTWLRPNTVLQPRFLKFSAQIDF
ncbi:MAG: TonB-dependent receptor [Acidobacteriota bacterium]